MIFFLKYKSLKKKIKSDKMKKLIILIALVYAISCLSTCEDEINPSEPETCHNMKETSVPNSYCCYYEGHNLSTDVNEKRCWEFEKSKIDNDGVDNVISQIEKGTDSHVTKPHDKVKLDCFASYLQNYFLLGLLLLLF